MFLKKLIMVNWGNLPNGEFEFGPINLFSGGNGSGKTTAADMIQTIMTAAYENLFQYNPGQDETTQKGRGGKKVRTLASYILGCDDGSYARLNPTDGYMAATFHPSQGESGEPFTALLGVRAWIEQAGKNRLAKQELLVFYILTQQQNRYLSLDDLQPNQSVLTLDNLDSSLIQMFGKSCVEKYETKQAYLRRLYGVLRGKKDAVNKIEAMTAARSFSRFMAYKPVQSIDRFVADEILEKKDLGEAISSISNQLKTIHGMEKDASLCQESVDILAGALLSSQSYLEGWRDLQLTNYKIAKHQYVVKQRDYLKAKQQERQFIEEQKDIEQKINVNEQRVEQLHQQLVSLEAQRQGIPALQQKDQLEQQRLSQNKRLAKVAEQLLLQNQALDKSIVATKEIVKLIQSPKVQQDLPAIAELKSLSMAKSLLALKPEQVLNVQDLMAGDLLNDIQGLEKQLDDLQKLQSSSNQWFALWHQTKDNEKSLITQVDNQLDRLERSYNNIYEERKVKQKTVDKLLNQKVSYPDYVEKALLAIINLCPQADPRVLCDHVEVTDQRWQAAIEGYLGGARFSIIVDQDFEADAIRIVRSLPGKRNPAKIIQGSKAEKDASRVSLPRNSICHLMKFSHAIAKNYLLASYGNVEQVDNEQLLRSTRRGITVDCIASGSYSMFRCDIAESALVFGVDARKRALLGQQLELDRLTEKWNELNNSMIKVRQLSQQLSRLSKMDLVEQLGEAMVCRRELQKIDNLIEQIDLSDHKELQEKLDSLSSEEQQRRTEVKQLLLGSGELDNKISSLKKRYLKISDEKDDTEKTVESCEQELQKSQAIWPDFSVERYLEEADREAVELALDLSLNFLDEQKKSLYRQEKNLDEAIRKHNQVSKPGDTLIYDAFQGDIDLVLFSTIVKLQLQIDNLYNRLKNNILLEKHEQLKQLKESFNHTFVSNLCHSIHQAINDGKRQIELLNKELQHHQFGDDRETFRFDYDWVPEYKEYAKFFEEVIKNPDLNDGQTLFEASLKSKSIQVRDRLMKMLLEDDSDRALRDLARIADYRNYRRYEIYKEVAGKEPIALSEYGTGSGGQLETPAYIIRAAAITSAFRFAEGSCHLRTVLVDEAFSKMDETRSREVINYLTNSLGLQLIFIMPTSKCGPFMDLISNEFVFAKCPSEQLRGELSTRVLVDRKVCNQEKIASLWANHKRTVCRQADLDFLDEVVI